MLLKQTAFVSGDEGELLTFIHMKPTGTPSSPALENIAFPISFVICEDH